MSSRLLKIFFDSIQAYWMCLKGDVNTNVGKTATIKWIEWTIFPEKLLFWFTTYTEYLLKIICINVFKVLIYEFCWKKYYRLQIEIIRHFIKDFHRSTCKEFIVPPIFFSCYGNKKFELLAANQINLSTIKISFCSISIPVSRKKKNKKN